MRSMKLLKEAAHLLETPGDFTDGEKSSTIAEIGSFLSEQQKKAESNTEDGIRVSTDGENWEYTDNVQIVSHLTRAGQKEVREFTMKTRDGELDIDFKTTINSESLNNKVSFDIESLNNFTIKHF